MFVRREDAASLERLLSVRFGREVVARDLAPATHEPSLPRAVAGLPFSVMDGLRPTRFGEVATASLLAVVVLIFIWYPIGLILSIFSLEEFSPISLNRAISTQLRRSWRETDAEAKDNANVQDADVITDQVSNFFSVLSGVQPKPKASKPDFFEGEKFDDFSLLRVTLGYGLPTIAAVILASLCFYWRDM